ncbi:MAG: SIMPL domain-containing protein [Cyanobium sp.]
MTIPADLGGRLSSHVRRIPPLVAAMAVLGVGMVLSSAILVKGIRRANDTITVTGASTERIRSDHVDWSVSVAASGPSQQASYQALQPLVSQTVAFLEAQGIPSDQIQREAVRSDREDQRDPRSNELRSTTWTSRQEIRVSSADVDKVRAVAAAAGELIGQGVPLTINPPAFTYSKLAEKRVDMLAKATRDAAERARAIAREAGSSIGPITSADTGTFQLTAPNSTEVGNSGSYDTTTVDKDITAVMAVTFKVR